MTLDPVLLKSQEYILYVESGKTSSKAYFDPAASTKQPWSLSPNHTKMLGLNTLSHMERRIPALREAILRTDHFMEKHSSKLQAMGKTISLIADGVKTKVAKQPGVCSQIYAYRVEEKALKLLEKLNELSFVEIEKEIDDLLPQLNSSTGRTHSTLLIGRVQNLTIPSQGRLVKKSALSDFENQKKYLISKIKLYKYLWSCEKLEGDQKKTAKNSNEYSVLKKKEKTIYEKHYAIVSEFPSLAFEKTSLRLFIKNVF